MPILDSCPALPEPMRMLACSLLLHPANSWGSSPFAPTPAHCRKSSLAFPCTSRPVQFLAGMSESRFQNVLKCSMSVSAPPERRFSPHLTPIEEVRSRGRELAPGGPCQSQARQHRHSPSTSPLSPLAGPTRALTGWTCFSSFPELLLPLLQICGLHFSRDVR